jgi:hypothetical protein
VSSERDGITEDYGQIAEGTFEDLRLFSMKKPACWVAIPSLLQEQFSLPLFLLYRYSVIFCKAYQVQIVMNRLNFPASPHKFKRKEMKLVTEEQNIYITS